ncbi:MAG TPA: TonB-dependent receptor [Chryseosolibacter sp.]|nr:TonB-dependent receptor [Chryseosolibacter sp.]
MNKKLRCGKNRTIVFAGLVMSFVIMANASLAQQVSGKVSADNGEAIPGVNVIVEGTSSGTTTDADGAYTVTVNDPNAVLVFSFIGYKTERVPVQNRTAININLVPDVLTLSEVVVVGYGTQKKTSMTSAVSTISAEDVITRQAPNTITLLQGRTPGLQIVQNSAQPGDESNQIRIRGQGTFSSAGSNPLILIDGVEGKLELLNPNMIQDISVLKDAASAAIYGSRAANGVILVTTKKGTEGRLNIEYNYTFSTQNPSVKVDRITDPVEYMQLVNKAIDYTGMNPQWEYTDEEISMYSQDTIPTADWTDYLIRTAPMHKHFLNLNGGKGGTTFNAGLGILDETGLLLGTDFTRYDAQFNFRSNLGGRVTFGNNLSLARSRRHDTVFDRSVPSQLLTANASEDQMLAAYAAPPLSIPVLPDGSGRFTGLVLQNKGGNKNPIAVAEGGGGRDVAATYLLFSPYVSVKIIDELTADIKGALRFEEEMGKAMLAVVDTYEYFAPHNKSGSIGSANQLFQRNTRENHYTLFGTLNYVKTLANAHHVNVLAGYQQETYRNDQVDAFRRDLPTSQLWEIDAGPQAGMVSGGTAYEWALQSFFGRASYDFKNKYLFEASFRDDASSRFPAGNKWALFPSVSAGWRLSEETFMAGIGWVDNLKIRASWGRLGNQNIGNYPYQRTLETSSYNFNGTLVQGLSVGRLVNTDIRWETTTVADIGLDFEMLQGKVFGSIDWYKKNTTGILRSLQLPDHVGLDEPTINDGELENKGWEVTLGHRNKIGDFSYTITGNFDAYQNKLIRFGAREISGVNVREEGLPYNQYYVLINDGVYQNQEEIDNGPVPAYSTSVPPKPGTLKYRDVSGPDGVPDGQVDLTYDKVPVDGVFPKFNYSFNITTQYKQFDLSVFVQGVHGRKTYVTGWGVAPFQQASAPPVWWRGAWDGEGTSNSIPHIFMDGYAPNNQVSTFWLGNSSYMRIKNLQVGYTLPVAWANKMKMQTFRVFAAADNLYTKTKFFQGLDPERTASGSARAAIYPQATIYSLGARVIF